ncbi:hypothetical protein HMPREF0307_02209 [Corynebacterium sp. DNF00584]|nr:hypothetical protein HMPREF0307_02209 [Corynebacterium sp. DNF00584]
MVLFSRWEGSSPLTRGALETVLDFSQLDRLIPAHAGSTSLMSSRRRRLSAHPRSRGEHFYINDVTWQRIGSSPLTRGAHPVCGVLAKQLRLIPAHAGSTARRYGLGMKSPAHPRSRGEHSIWLIATPHGVGSSPLTRGAPIRAGEPVPPVGLIPAHAGSTVHVAGLIEHRWAHPRSRGEHGVSRVLAIHPLGLIPAHAGSTSEPVPCQRLRRAHPRSRGEHWGVMVVSNPPRGSSPLTRGARSSTVPAKRCSRLIPAHAGSTRRAGGDQASTRAHPRSRGEHTKPLQLPRPQSGSSPLTRGAPSRLSPHHRW